MRARPALASTLARRLLPALLLVLTPLLASCAGGGVGARTFDNPLGIPQNAAIQEAGEAPVFEVRVPAPPELVAEKVPGVYRHVGLETFSMGAPDPMTFVTKNLRISGRLYEGERNSAYIDCGSAMQGERADLYDVEFAMATRLRPDGEGGTLVQTRLEGQARDKFVNESQVYCVGTGKLEQEIGQLLRRGDVG